VDITNTSIYEMERRMLEKKGIRVAEDTRDADHDEGGEQASARILADLDQPGERVCVARGGPGGRGNPSFSSKADRAPKRAETGRLGDKFRIELELKVVADIGLIGFPNAGKSSLLACVSRATPKIAAYPFTTLRPYVGVVDQPPDSATTFVESFTVADIPGLIRGAHKNIGLGHVFLRHVERTKLLVLVVDAAGSEGRVPLEDLLALQEELELYLPGLSHRSRLIIANKMDLPGAEEKLEELREGLAGLDRAKHGWASAPLIPVSALSRRELPPAVEAMRSTLGQMESEKAKAAAWERKVQQQRQQKQDGGHAHAVNDWERRRVRR